MISGECRALICAVGPNVRAGATESIKDQLENDTALQTKMKNLTDQLSIGALLCGFIILVELIILTFIAIGIKDPEFNKDGVKNDAATSNFELLVKDLPNIVNIVIIFIVVAIPEGLAMTIGISLAFSVIEMFNENILIRKLNAPERLGGIQEIIVGKTGTITTNIMKVDSFYFEG